MLVIIVSLGFGIVKPRLGPTLHRVVGIGGLYFVIASTEAWLRIVKPKNDLSSTTLFAGIPLAVIDRWSQTFLFRVDETNTAFDNLRNIFVPRVKDLLQIARRDSSEDFCGILNLGIKNIGDGQVRLG